MVIVDAVVMRGVFSAAMVIEGDNVPLSKSVPAPDAEVTIPQNVAVDEPPVSSENWMFAAGLATLLVIVHVVLLRAIATRA
jgi:hypothetical protein